MKPKQVYIGLDPVDTRLLNLVGETLDLNNSKVVEKLLNEYVAAVPQLLTAVQQDKEYQKLWQQREQLKAQKAQG